MTFTVREATVADAAAIAKLGGNVFAATFGYAIPDDDLETYLSKTYTPSAISSEIENSKRDFFVAVDGGGQVRGFAVLAHEDTRPPCVEGFERVGELQRMYVDTSAHGLGAGWALLSSVEERAKEKGYWSLWLSSFEENKPTRQAYERWGFRHVGEDQFHIGSVVHGDIIMVKTFQQ